ncbi:MAG: 4'-phosphopantetheinyl transferase superfamily protein [Ardenticatenales bacterium]
MPMPAEPLSPPPSTWPPAPSPCPLLPGHAHVHRVPLDLSEATVHAMADVLAPDERARAAKQRRPRDGARWIVARAALRYVLASYIGGDAADVEFVVDDLGKPRLAPSTTRSAAVRAADLAFNLSFNLSHSDGIALIAVTRGARIGVDIEATGRRTDFAAIAERYFSNSERAYLARLTPDVRADAFFVLWTAKEAYTKALGTGLSAGFPRFAVVVAEDGRLAVDAAGGSDWSLCRLAPGRGYHGALAMDVADVRVHRWEWRPATGG